MSFSLTLPATRAAVPELGALFVGAARSLIAGLLALSLLRLRRERFPREHWVPLAVVAASVVLGFPFATALALRSVPAAHATIVIGLVPLATVLYAVARNGERPSRDFWIAALVGGAAVVLFGESRGGLELHGADGWLLAAVVLAALGYSEGARLAKTLGGFRVISWALVLALPVSLPSSLLAWPERALSSVSPGALGGLLYVSFVSMYLGMIVWYRGLAQGSLARASQIQLLQPVLSLGWGSLLLGEALSPVTLFAAGLVLACAVWARRARVALPRAALARQTRDVSERKRRARGGATPPTACACR